MAETGLWFQQVLSLLLKKVVVPTDYHERVKEVKHMLENDLSGLIDTLTDFAVDSSSVNYSIESENENLNELLNNWLTTINKDFRGQIPSGINALAEEYFKERWKSSSFPVLKISKWERGEANLLLPSKMFFVDGESIYSNKDKLEDDTVTLGDLEYFIGDDEEHALDKNVVITKPYGRWQDKYPVPFLVKRGVLHNYKLMKSLKEKQIELLDQVIPYLFLVKKGTERLAIDKNVNYTNDQLEQIQNQFQELLTELHDAKITDTEAKADRKTPIRTTQFDEQIEHLIPDLSTMFEPKLFQQAEQNILAGLGFIDIAEAVSNSRKESVLNPTPFIQDVKQAVKDFVQILNEVILMIIDKNSDNRKYMNTKLKVCHTPVTAFMTDDFKERIRQLYDRGRISSQTAVELVGELDFETEVRRREKEAKDGVDETLYPPVTKNQEGVGIDLPGLTNEDGDNQENIDSDTEEQPDAKTDPVERENFDVGSDLTGAPFETLKDLPKSVKNKVSNDLQRVWFRVFNRAFQEFQNDARASRLAWGVISKIGRKNKKGIWVHKKKRSEGKLKPLEVSEDILKSVITEMKNEDLERNRKEKDEEFRRKQEQLLDHIIETRDKEEK